MCVCNTEKLIVIYNYYYFLGDGSIGANEFRFDCVNRMAYKSVKDLDDAFDKLLNVSMWEWNAIE